MVVDDAHLAVELQLVPHLRQRELSGDDAPREGARTDHRRLSVAQTTTSVGPNEDQRRLERLLERPPCRCRGGLHAGSPQPFEDAYLSAGPETTERSDTFGDMTNVHRRDTSRSPGTRTFVPMQSNESAARARFSSGRYAPRRGAGSRRSPRARRGAPGLRKPSGVRAVGVRIRPLDYGERYRDASTGARASATLDVDGWPSSPRPGCSSSRSGASTCGGAA